MSRFSYPFYGPIRTGSSKSSSEEGAAAWSHYQVARVSGDSTRMDQAWPFLYQAATLGHDQAMEVVYLMALKKLGWGNRGKAADSTDVSGAVALLWHAAQGGHPWAQLDLVLTHLDRRMPLDFDLPDYESPVEGPDHAEVLHFLRQAAEAGVVEARERLLKMHESGVRIVDPPDHAPRYLESVASKDPEPALIMLMLLAARAGETDSRLHAQILLRAVRAGDPFAIDELHGIARQYFRDGSETRDEAFAIECLRAMADRGHADSQHDLGVAYAKGWGVLRSIPLALTWLERAGNANAHWGMFRIRNSPELGFFDAELAFEHLRQAAQGGHAKASAMLKFSPPYLFRPRPPEST